MYSKIAKLVVYRNVETDGILFHLSDICKRFDSGAYIKEDLTAEIYVQIHRLLDVATRYGFDNNLWHNYLAFLLATTENPFSLVCEKSGARDGSVNLLATNDFKIFKDLFDYDFSQIEAALQINCFSIISNYKAIEKDKKKYNTSVSEKVRALSLAIEKAPDETAIFAIVTEFYRIHGVGLFGLNKVFRLKNSESEVELEPITNTVEVYLRDLVGYEYQKKMLVDNTEAFIQGRKANNLLLHGDSGTGKSTCIKALLNEYQDSGLRIIEMYKHQFKDLSTVITMIKNRNYRFIIYMDDLSFEEFEIEYKYLKAVIEGGLEITPDNVLIYATSNRRHLIKETWSDRKDATNENEIHHSDTVEEKMSLVNRFGVTINFMKPSQKEYLEIVKGIAKNYPEITLSEDELVKEAYQWGAWHGNISGRRAQQFINHLLGLAANE
jgi:predicted AAA+ superfamily ATPase